MIVIGIGANLPHPKFSAPRRTCGAALAMLEERAIHIIKCATWYRTAPVLADHRPKEQEGQPWYVNGAAAVATDLDSQGLLKVLLDVEAEFGRVRSTANAPRTLDLDIISFNEQVLNDDGLNIPHPRMHERAFVLYPLRDLAPEWHHPVMHTSISELIEALPADQSFDAMTDSNGLFGTEWHENEGIG
jgi:2-amino-4-hydroxy-6-hydroxymethyldihydropteridine diphosphokinase